MDNKLFKFEITEYNGEQEYSNDCYVWAKDRDEANRLAHEFALKEWYLDEEVTECHKNYFEGDFGNSWRLFPAKEFEFHTIYPINGQPISFKL